MKLTRTEESNYNFGVPYHLMERVNLRVKSDEVIKRNKDIIKQKSIVNKNKKKIKKKTKTKDLQTKSEIFIRHLRRHLRNQRARERYAKFKAARALVRDIKKQHYKYQDMQHPLYKKVNINRSFYFKDHILLRSHDGLTVGNAWSLLKKCWIGFKESYRLRNKEGMLHYGKGIQKYLYLLEEVPIDFSSIGLKPFKDFY